MSFCVVVSYAKDNIDKATVGLTLANAALDIEEQVSVVFTSEGVRLAVKGYADGIDNGEPFKPMKQLIRQVLEKGGELKVCTPCMQKRGLRESDMIEGVDVIGGLDVIRVLKRADRSIQL